MWKYRTEKPLRPLRLFNLPIQCMTEEHYSEEKFFYDIPLKLIFISISSFLLYFFPNNTVYSRKKLVEAVCNSEKSFLRNKTPGR